jgi:uncharacterized protein (TIGR00369 family)
VEDRIGTMSAPPGSTQTELSDPFEIHLGPVFETGAKGARRFVLRVDERHLNGRGVVHGGMLMTFADLALGQAAWDATDHAFVVTINMQAQFLKAARAGDLIEVAPQLVRRTRSLLFLRGDFEVAGDVIFTASSIWKVLGEN